MPICRIYTTGPDGYLFGIPKVAECVDDKEAVEKAVLWANDRDVEISVSASSHVSLATRYVPASNRLI